jgi:hypothetical protein
MSRKDTVELGIRLVTHGDVDLVRDGRTAEVRATGVKTQNRALLYTPFEFDFVHADRDECATRKIERGGDPRDFVNPFKHVAAKQVAEVVEILGHHELVRFHDRTFYVRHERFHLPRADILPLDLGKT